MIPGVSIAMGGREWTVPPLTLGQLRRLMPKVQLLSEIGASIGEAQIGVLVELVAAALQRNYPEVTAEKVEEMLDLGNAGAVLDAVLTGSGLARAPGGAGGAPDLGEAPAPGAHPGASPARPSSAGGTSTASSPPPAATATPSSTR